MEEGFNLVRRRTSDLVSNVQTNFPKMPQMPQMPKMPQGLSMPSMPNVQLPSIKPGNKEPTMHGTWERISLPPIPRSSHSLDIIYGNAYIFGGEIDPRKPVDNDLHVVNLPWSSASADYYKIKPKGALKEVKKEAKKEPVTQESEEYTSRTTTESEASDTPDENPDEDSPKLEKTTEGRLDKGKGRATDVGKQQPSIAEVPAPRVGHATAAIGSRIFLFGGRGGPEMKPLEEEGRVWVFDTRDRSWDYLDPEPAIKGGTITIRPGARSYHCATASERPSDFPKQPAPRKAPANWRERIVGDTSQTGIPQAPIVGNVAESAIDQEAEGYGTFFIHGGCLSNGERTNDMWAFDVRTRTWTELPAAPGPARGGSAICISKSRLYRYGGYDGEKEIGGQLDFLQLEVEMFDDKTTRGEISMRSRGTWQSIHKDNIDASSNDIPVESSQAWPGARSVAAFHSLTIGGGTEYLVLAFGEGSPSTDGHGNAGKFYGDVWTFQVPPQGMTPASFTAAFMQAVGRKTGEGKWLRVTTSPYDEDSTDYEQEPARRGWLASAVLGETEESAIVFWGGLGEDNKRLGDGWILRLG
ncbi:hypothetical protein N3K66_005041 [Trichothecium roseum]|uniref:Uncharacterized protein n=1 Tax=Trichothecium roseum TaxID=47278 RepID=A0ACC0V303_9HYPO|nr:hypothetical protein N3K66_005041 [Trichothecium roseum]